MLNGFLSVMSCHQSLDDTCRCPCRLEGSPSGGSCSRAKRLNSTFRQLRRRQSQQLQQQGIVRLERLAAEADTGADEYIEVPSRIAVERHHLHVAPCISYKRVM